MTGDKFGIPDTVFGVHDEDFFPALGRVVALSALLEDHVLRIYQTVTNSSQNEGTHLGVSGVLARIEKAISHASNQKNLRVLRAYCTDVGSAFRKRNDFIHSVWPAQQEDRLFGWRANRNKGAEDRPVSPTMLKVTNMGELKEFILELVELIQRWQSVYPAARDQQMTTTPGMGAQ